MSITVPLRIMKLSPEQREEISQALTIADALQDEVDPLLSNPGVLEHQVELTDLDLLLKAFAFLHTVCEQGGLFKDPSTPRGFSSN